MIGTILRMPTPSPVTESGHQPRIGADPAMGRNRGGREAFGHEDERPKPPGRAAATFNLRRGARVSGSYPAIRGGRDRGRLGLRASSQCMAALSMAFRCSGDVAVSARRKHCADRALWSSASDNGACLSHAPVATLRRFRTRPWPLCGSRCMSARATAPNSRRPGHNPPAMVAPFGKRELRAWRPRRPPASRRGCQFFQATVQGLRVCGRRNCERANTWSDHATVALPQ
jgi:hypothetical protein